MKKQGGEKSVDKKNKEKESKRVYFELTTNALDCFISKRKEVIVSKVSKPKNQKLDELKLEDELNSRKLRLPAARNKAASMIQHNNSCFNHQLLLLQYGKEEVYIDSIKTEGSKRSKTPSPDHNEPDQFDFLDSCVRVITEETSCTSNPISARVSQISQTPIEQPYPEYAYFDQPYSEESTQRNKRAISVQQSRNFVIDIDRVEQDGRLTVMVRNIPIKYTQEMLIELFSKEQKIQKFDFFYLPIDFKNNCNVGYAFLNFLHPKFIKDFYYKFHGNKWEKFNSKKIIQVCYARIQGTAQLACHFENSKVIQKDKRVRPVGLNESDYAHISSIVNKQKTKF